MADKTHGALTQRERWEGHWQREKKGHPDGYIFDGILRPLLPQGGDYLEIGCAPGATMAYFHRNYGYRVCGIDYAGIPLVQDTMRHYGIGEYEAIDADFLTYRFPEGRQFDVVASFGFIEHFSDFRAVLLRQAALVRPGGHLVCEVPNLRGLNYLLFRLLQPRELEGHNLAAMAPSAIADPLRRYGFRIRYARYVGTCFVHFDAQNPYLADHPARLRLVRAARQALGAVGLGNAPSAWLSPYIVVVATRDVQGKGT